MTAGQVSDYTGAAALLDDLPKAQWLRGCRSCCRGHHGGQNRDRLSRTSPTSPILLAKRVVRAMLRLQRVQDGERPWSMIVGTATGMTSSSGLFSPFLVRRWNSCCSI